MAATTYYSCCTKYPLCDALDGYDCAKKTLAELPEFEAKPFVIKSHKIKFTKEDLSMELLNYRRENNLYEIGDKVVSTLAGEESWKNVICEIEGFHKDMIITKCGNEIIHHYNYRHATDDEIEAEYRDLALTES